MDFKRISSFHISQHRCLGTLPKNRSTCNNNLDVYVCVCTYLYDTSHIVSIDSYLHFYWRTSRDSNGFVSGRGATLMVPYLYVKSYPTNEIFIFYNKNTYSISDLSRWKQVNAFLLGFIPVIHKTTRGFVWGCLQ